MAGGSIYPECGTCWVGYPRKEKGADCGLPQGRSYAVGRIALQLGSKLAAFEHRLRAESKAKGEPRAK